MNAMLDEPPEHLDWTWDHTLVAGGLSMIVAKPKVGKSTTARNLALAVARGTPFLGRNTKQGPVIYLELEEKRDEVRKRFAAMGAAGAPISIHVGPAPVEDTLLKLRLAIDEKKAVLAIIDPLFKMVRIKDGNDYAEVSRVLDPLMQIGRSTGCHILVAHHFGKAQRDEAGDQVLGSTALLGGVDSAIFLRKRENFRVLSSTQRYGTDFEEIVVAIDPKTNIVMSRGSLAEAEIKSTLESIRELLAAQRKWMSGDQIAAAGQMRRRLAYTALRAGLDDKNLERAGGGKKGDPHVFQLAGFPTQHPYKARDGLSVLRKNGGSHYPSAAAALIGFPQRNALPAVPWGSRGSGEGKKPLILL